MILALCLCIQIDGNRVKRRYAMCPPDFRRIGNVCYFISENRTNWLSAHFECRDRKSQLAEPIKLEDRYLRKYLNHLSLPTYDELWIGGIFNWERNKWQWGYDAKEMTYQSFSRMPRFLFFSSFTFNSAFCLVSANASELIKINSFPWFCFYFFFRFN